MNTPQEVINRARKLWGVSAGQYNDAQALQDFNIIYQELSDLIIQDVDERYFSDLITTPLVANQEEYTLTDLPNKVRVNKINKSEADFKNNGKYVSISHTFLENSIFISPIPETSTWTLRLNAALTPLELEIADTIEYFPSTQIHRIVEGMLPYIYQIRQLFNEKNDATRAYETTKVEMIFALTNRDSGAQEIIMPNLDELS